MAGEPGAARVRGLGRIAWKVLRYLLIALLALPVVFAALFLAIQEASERQWLGRAPEHPAIDVRSDQPHTVQLLDVGFDSLAERLRLIDGAERTIELEFFIYELDEASRLVTQALARKAAEGVQVRLLVDFALPVFKLAPAYLRAGAARGRRGGALLQHQGAGALLRRAASHAPKAAGGRPRAGHRGRAQHRQ